MNEIVKQYEEIGMVAKQMQKQGILCEANLIVLAMKLDREFQRPKHEWTTTPWEVFYAFLEDISR